MTKDEHGVGILPWLDCAAEGDDDVILPDCDEMKEATLLFMRKSTSIALSTTVGSLEVRMRSLPLKNSPHVIPEFTPSVDGTDSAPG